MTRNEARMVLLVGPRMVRESARLGQLLARRGLRAVTVGDQAGAAAALLLEPPAAMVLGLALSDGAALAVADLASYRHPEVPLIFLGEGRAFSDGSIFAHSRNAHAILPGLIALEDLVEVIAWHADAAAGSREVA